MVFQRLDFLSGRRHVNQTIGVFFGSIWIFMGLLVGTLFSHVPGAEACHFTLEGPDFPQVVVTGTVEPTVHPKSDEDWSYTHNGEKCQMVGTSLDGPVTITLHADYVGGGHEGSVNGLEANVPDGILSNKDWEVVDQSTIRLTVPADEMIPRRENDYWTRFPSYIGLTVNYQYGEPQYNDQGELTGYVIQRDSNYFHGILVLATALQVVAQVDRSKGQLLVGLYEEKGPDQEPSIVKGARFDFEEQGGFNLAFDKVDEDNFSHYNITAPLGSNFDADGYFRDVIRIKAKSKGATGIVDFKASLGFAVAFPRGSARLLSREGVLIEPRSIQYKEVLVPGDLISVDSGDLLLVFANGESSLVQADFPVRVLLGSNGIANQRSVISFWAENFVYDVKNDPRKYVKIALSKLASAAADEFLPGVHWIIKKGVSEAAEYGVQLMGSHSSKSRPQKAAMVAEAIPESPGTGAQTNVNIFPGGAVMFHVVRGQALVDYGAGTTTMDTNSMTMGNLNAQVPFITSPGGQGYQLPMAAMCFSVQWYGDGSEIDTRTPAIGFQGGFDPYTNEPCFSPDYLDVRINGRLVAGVAIDPLTGILPSIVVPAEVPLKAGSNSLEAWMEEAHRPYRHKVQGSIAVSDQAFSAPPSDVLAFFGSENRTIIRWSTPAYPDIKGFEIGRSNSQSGTYTLLNSEPCSQHAWIDNWQGNTPPVSYWYRIRTLYQNGLCSEWSVPVEQKRVEKEDIYMSFGPPSGLKVTNDAGGLSIEFEDGMPEVVFWKLERGLSSSGPWEDVLHGQFLSGSGYVDKDVNPDTQYWYRLSAMTVLGDGPEATVAGPVTWDGRPASPTGLTCYIQDGTAELRWDPATDDSVTGFTIYRNAGTGFLPIASLPVTATSYEDHIHETGSYEWRVKAVADNGRESLKGAETGSVYRVSVQASGQVSLGDATEHSDEGELTASVPLIRTGGSSGPLLVTVVLVEADGTTGEQQSKYGGTVIFTDGETNKVLTCALDPGYHLVHFLVSGEFGLNSGSGAVGDVSGDGNVNIVDALFIARHAVGLSVSGFNEDAADVNCNGQIDIVDALLVARKAVGLQVQGWCGSAPAP